MGGRKIQVQLECFGSGRMEAPGAPLMLKLQPAEDPSNVKAIRTSEHSRIETKPVFFYCYDTGYSKIDNVLYNFVSNTFHFLCVKSVSVPYPWDVLLISISYLGIIVLLFF
eukprot:TRINITY_DN6654_c1_g2_i1.p1 TRINITY_DN6654_c1_g2~~TRINITY_DN6654_c1_g2_i1.p1  ORF type:complete len:111 (-),score=9.13 TRINITY_DN6654_c1_g2_i1:655-987(-)